MARGNVITTIVTAARSYDLTTLGVVKQELDKTDGADDAILKRYLSSASAAVANYCNRVFVQETVKDEFWPARDPSPSTVSGGLGVLQLSRYPVISSPAAVVIENDTTLTVTTDYRIDATNGQVVRFDSNSYPRSWCAWPISVQYAAGFATIPSDVVDAVIRMVVKRWLAKGQDLSLRHESIPGVYEYDRWVASGSEAGNMTPDVTDLLDGYRVPVIA